MDTIMLVAVVLLLPVLAVLLLKGFDRIVGREGIGMGRGSSLLLCVGVCMFVYAMGLDTSVETPFGTRIGNFPLMQQQTNLMAFGGLLAVLGAIFAARNTASQGEAKKRPLSAAPMKRPLSPASPLFAAWALDMVLIVAAYVLANLIRFDWSLDPALWAYVGKNVLLVLVIKPPIFAYYRVHERSTAGLATLIEAVSVSSALLLVGVGVVANRHSRGVVLIDWFVLLFLIAARYATSSAGQPGERGEA